MQTQRAPAKTLLVVSGAREAMPIIAAARRMGLRVLVSDGAPDAPGFRQADAGLLAPTADAEASVEAARAYAQRTRIDGVIGVGAEVARTVAAVAEALGLAGIPPATAALAADRLALRARLRARGVAVPWCAPVEGPAALEALAARTQLPLALRPVDGALALRLLPDVDPRWAVEVAAAASPGGSVMVEEQVAGARVRAQAIVVDGRATTVALADRDDEVLERFAPFVVERGSTLPSAAHPAAAERIAGTVAAAAAALGMRAGTLSVEVVLGPRGPVLVELGTGLSGGYVGTHEVPLATGVDLVAAEIRLALGETAEPGALRARWCQGVARRFLLPAPGTVTSVRGAAEAAAGEGIALLEVVATPGQRIGPPGGRGCHGGVVIAVDETREGALRRAEAAAARVRIVTMPGPGAAAWLLN
jgi:biotin carboxylase